MRFDMHFDLTDLRLFLAVTQAGSITHGAAAVGLSLSAASERLRDMEAAGGVRLLDRSRRGVSLTEPGAAVLQHARLILHQMAQMQGEIGRYATAVRSTVRVLANTAAMTEFLPARLVPWLARNPRADIELKARQSIDIARGIALGLADIGVLSDAVDTAGLELYPFATDRLVVVVARGHALAAARQVRFADLAGQPFLALTGGALQQHLDAQATRAGLHVRPRIALRSFADICLMAGSDVGVGIVPATAARRHRRATGIAIVPLAETWASRQLALCVRTEGDLTPAARDLLTCLRAG